MTTAKTRNPYQPNRSRNPYQPGVAVPDTKYCCDGIIKDDSRFDKAPTREFVQGQQRTTPPS